MLARWTPYLESEMLGLGSLVGPGSVCLDAGAAAGLYSFVLSRLVGPSGQVYSIEPLTFAHPLWRRVLRTADCVNVSHHAVAMSAEPGEGVMSVPYRRLPVTGRSFLAGQATGLGPNAEFHRHEEVPVPIDTIDGLRERTGLSRLDFIKVDVEGAELHVLRGGQRTLKEFQPTILLEIEARHTARYDYTTKDVVDWMDERGYRMYAWQRGWHEASAIVPQQRNYLFQPDRTARSAPSHP
jgi:FkbM family methyltransferase